MKVTTLHRVFEMALDTQNELTVKNTEAGNDTVACLGYFDSEMVLVGKS